MSAAAVWIGLPLVMATLIAAGRNRYTWLPLTGVLAAAALALIGWLAPVDEPISAGPIELTIRSEQIVLGRSLLFEEGTLRIAGAAYAALALWGLGGLVLGSNPYFLSSGLAATALLCAGLAVQPWQFAGIFILLAVLVLVPLLMPPGAGPATAVLKFVAFQAVGIPFLIIAGTLMEGLESIPAGLSLTLRPAIFLGFSFIFLLAVFPFHGWIPGLVEDYEALPVGFVLVLLPGFIGVFGLQLIDRHAFMRNSPEFFTLVRTVGMMTTAAGSALVLAQRHAGRILGFTALIETGLLLLAVGAGAEAGSPLFFPVMAARSAAFMIWSGGLSTLSRRGFAFDFAGLRAAMWRQPIACAAVLAGIFSTAGFPLLTGFPAKLRLAAALSEIDPTAVIAVWMGMTATAAAGVRLFAALAAPPRDAPGQAEPQAEETAVQEVAVPRPALPLPELLLAAGCLMLVLFGLFPNWVGWLSAILAPAFEHLAR